MGDPPTIGLPYGTFSLFFLSVKPRGPFWKKWRPLALSPESGVFHSPPFPSFWWNSDFSQTPNVNHPLHFLFPMSTSLSSPHPSPRKSTFLSIRSPLFPLFSSSPLLASGCPLGSFWATHLPSFRTAGPIGSFSLLFLKRS